ncbi:hypothetical protein QT972_15240 [Microcoleus sp. herbarium7]|uniref:hypothetical protein n=1 Tax=Microcoleus sp. herbarium7 TaxID=3055435 RepID=UPI002FD6BD6F
MTRENCQRRWNARRQTKRTGIARSLADTRETPLPLRKAPSTPPNRFRLPFHLTNTGGVQ